MSDSTSTFRWFKWLPEAAILVVWTTSIFGLVWGLAAERADVRHELREQRATVTDHEARLRTLEKQAGEIAADVRWIRLTLEKQKP